MFQSLASEGDNQSIRQFNEARKKRKQNDFAIFASFSQDDSDNKRVEEMIAAKTSQVADPIREFEIRKVHLVGSSRRALIVLDFYIQKMQSQQKDIISASSFEVDQLSLKEKIQIKSLMSTVCKDFKILTHLLASIERLQKTDQSISFQHYQSDFNIIEEVVKRVAKIGEEFTETQRNVQTRGTLDKAVMKTPEQGLGPITEVLDIQVGLKHILENREKKENQSSPNETSSTVLTSTTSSNTVVNNCSSPTKGSSSPKKQRRQASQYEPYLSDHIGLLKCEYELALTNFVKESNSNQ